MPGRRRPKIVIVCWPVRVLIGRVRTRVGQSALGLALLAGAGCGDSDVTTIYGEEPQAGAPEQDPSESRTFAVLAEPDSLDTVCRLLGVSRVTTGAGGPEACRATVEQCRSNVEAVLGTGDGDAPAVGLPAASLEPLLGCPLSVSELDGCVARVLERSIDAYGSTVSCDMPALPAVDTLSLFASPECLGVVLICPELIAGLAGG